MISHLNPGDSVVTPTVDGTRPNHRKNLMPGFFRDTRDLSVSNPSAYPLQKETPSTVPLTPNHNELPYMTVNSANLAQRRRSQVPESLSNRLKHLPKQI